MTGLAPNPTGCTFEDLHFVLLNSGVRIIPLELDIREDQNKDDYARITMTNTAAQVVQRNYRPKEPVAIEHDGEAIKRMMIPKGGVSVGETSGTVELYDPLILLEEGSIEGEYNKATMRELVNLVYGQVVDPQGVITGVRFNTDASEVRYQHPPGKFIPTTFGIDVADTIYELTPFVDGDGWFDFRDDTPRKALAEICQAFGTGMFINTEGTLVIGFPDAEPNAYVTGVDRDFHWNLLDYNIPDYEQPVGKVVVRGATEATDTETALAITAPAASLALSYNDTLEKVTPYASAQFAGGGGRVKTIEYGQSSSLGTLEAVAKNALVRSWRNARSGTIRVSTVANGSMANISEVKIGDVIQVHGDQDCGIPTSTLRIVGIHHDMSTRGTWNIEFSVTALLPSKIQTDTWEYTPLDSTGGEETTATLEGILGGISDMGSQIALALDAFRWANVAGESGVGGLSSGALFGGSGGEVRDPDDILGYDEDQLVETILEDSEG